MGLADVFSSEERIPVKFSEFYDLMKGCTERELLTNREDRIDMLASHVSGV